MRRELLLNWIRVVDMDEVRAREVLTHAGYNVDPGIGKAVQETPSLYEDWTLRRDAVLTRVGEALRVSEGSPDRDDALLTLECVLDLLEFKLRHEQSHPDDDSGPSLR